MNDLLQSINDAIGNGAESLDLSEGLHLTVPPEIGQLAGLTRLDLSNNQLAALPTEIASLTSLTVLDLSGNNIRVVPPEIIRLTSLTELNLSHNLLSDLPPEIGQLTELTELHLSDNQLAALPPEIGQLTGLTELNLGENKLTTLPPEIGQLAGLTDLALEGNQLSDLPPEIGQLTDLDYLDLDDNLLTALPPEIGRLTGLTVLYLLRNQLTALPPEIGELAELTSLDLRNNPLPVPPEILEDIDNPASIINYYLEQLDSAKRPLNEAKVLVVGQGGVGKTSLVNRLIHNDFDSNEGKTQGIDVHRWGIDCRGEEVRLNVWDFGGQEIMHATHQFFLTRRSLYLLVLDARQGELESRIEYWLKLIQSYGGDSPVIVVSNKSDQHELDLDWTGLQRKYPAIRGFARMVSCRSGKGIPDLRRMIEREVGQLEHIHDELPASWYSVKSELENMEGNYLPYERYEEMCVEQGIDREESRRTLLGFLHDLGVVLHFGDHPILHETNILNPEWVTKGVYQIINSELLNKNRGVLRTRDLSKMLRPAEDYPRDRHLFLTEMMRRFELCFDFPGEANQRFLVPDLLPREEPDTGAWDDCLEFQYHYDVLPGSVISRFIVGINEFIHENIYWRTGVVLEYEGARNHALVRADLEDGKVFIQVSGNEGTRREFLGVIRAELLRIHRSISGLVVRQKVPISGHSTVFADYDYLLDLEEMRELIFVPQGLKERIDVKQVLDGIEPEEARRENRRHSDGERAGSTYNFYGDTHLGDKFESKQIGVAGRNSRNRGVSVSRVENNIDLVALADELAKLKAQMLAEAFDPDHFTAVAEVAHAENAARGGDGQSAWQHLARVGNWGIGVATKIGAELAVAYSKSEMGV